MKKIISLKKLIVYVLILLAVVFVFSNNFTRTKVVHEAYVSNKSAGINTSTWDTNKVSIYTDSSGANVPIPKGYVVSGVSAEKQVKTGLVIYEGTASVTSAPTSGSSVKTSAQATRNQWVWIPVPDVSRLYSESGNIKTAKLYDYSSTGRTLLTEDVKEPGLQNAFDNNFCFVRSSFQGMTRESFNYMLQLEFEETLNSIQKYGGFYIGRYALGNTNSKVPVVKKMNSDLSSSVWYDLYNKIKYLSANSSVRTGIILGCLYDETLQWLVDTGSKTYTDIAVNSATWGNYLNASFTYINSSGSSVTKSNGSYVDLPTGCSEYTKANNIYDLTGNKRTWTMESYNKWAGGGRTVRGGDANNEGTETVASYRWGWLSPNENYTYVAYRACLYIK